jgi:hypothetical protein
MERFCSLSARFLHDFFERILGAKFMRWFSSRSMWRVNDYIGFSSLYLFGKSYRIVNMTLK